MKLAIILAVGTILISPLAYAFGDSTDTNTSTSTATNSSTNNNTGTSTNTITVGGGGGGIGGAGGDGGEGGDGGNANSTSHATGGSVSNSGNSSSTSHANGGNASVSHSGNSSAHQSQHQQQHQNQSISKSGNSSNSYVSEAQKRNPVSTAFAAPLMATEDTCMGSSSVGGQGVGFGLSVGSTWQDADCVRRKDARELHNMGNKGAAIALMCQNANVAKAMKTAGTPCVGDEFDNQSTTPIALYAPASSPRKYPTSSPSNY